MGKAFYLDYVRQVIEQTLLEEHIKNPNLVGGKNQLNLFSFYEQLEEKEEVDRYVETFTQLANQQNRMGLIANGILSAPENPTITNLNKHLIVPLSFICAFRITLQDRDLMLDTINNLISIRKGRKVDICEFNNGKLFVVGTLGNNVNGQPLIRVGDFIGSIGHNDDIDTYIKNRVATLVASPYNFVWESFGDRTQYLYYEQDNLLKVAIYNSSNATWEEKNNDNSYDDVIFPPTHTSFTKYKVSISFDALRCETPRSLNGKEIINISFGGTATIVDKSVKLGNDLTKLSICLYARKENDNLTYLDNIDHWLEPLEQPSGNNANTEMNRLLSNHFITNTHTNSLELSTNYTFILDDEETLVNGWFKYARYGTQTYITPNIIYKVKEYYSSWGNVYVGGDSGYLAKIVDSIDIENTESDTMTIAVSFQVQGENN